MIIHIITVLHVHSHIHMTQIQLSDRDITSYLISSDQITNCKKIQNLNISTIKTS